MRRSKLLRNFDFGEKKNENSLESVFSRFYIIAPHLNTRKVEIIRESYANPRHSQGFVQLSTILPTLRVCR